MKKLAIISTHPIQYNAPFFKLLAQEIGFQTKVFYTLGMETSGFVDPGFGKMISWDIPLLDGYDFTFVKNTSKEPTSSRFKGVINPYIISELEQFAPTHILVYGWSFDSHLKVIRHFTNKAKILFRGDSTLIDEKPGIRTFLRRLWLSWVYSFIDNALYVGTNNKQYYLKHRLLDCKLVFSPHAIDNGRFSDNAHSVRAESIKYELGVDADKKVFLFTGKFEPKKNPLLLIDAFKLAQPKDTVLLMVGNGVLEEELKIRAYGADNIRFMPFQNQSAMPAVYRVGNVLILPSAGPGETWGLCLNEAMASGLVVIASDKVGGAIDLIKEDENGFIFKSGDKDALVSILRKLDETPKKDINKMGAVSQNMINSWSYEKSCEVIRGIINKE